MKHLLISILLLASSAHANVGESFGFGSRTASLGGAGVAWGSDGYAAYSNPAALARPNAQRFRLSYGLVFMRPSFFPITNVVTENQYTSDAEQVGNVDTEYRDTFGQMIGTQFTILPDHWNLTIGVTSFLPIIALAYMDTGEAFVPEYVLYRARTQRPQIEAGIGASPTPHLYIGAGAHLAFSLTSDAFVFLQTTTGKPSTMRFTTSLRPKVSPYFGVLYRSSDGISDKGTGNWTAGAVLRLAATSNNTMILHSGARAFGDFAALDFLFGSVSALYYDPLSIEVGASVQIENFRLIGQIDYQAWALFEAPALEIEQPQTENCSGASGCTGPGGGVPIQPGQNPAFPYRDIVIPRGGVEYTYQQHAFRAGYAYRPSFMSVVPEGVGNYLDPPKHIFTGGYGYTFKELLNLKTPVAIDLHFSYHQLLSQDIIKTANDEAGSAGNKIGSPGYTAGGNLVGGGLSMTVAL